MVFSAMGNMRSASQLVNRKKEVQVYGAAAAEGQSNICTEVASCLKFDVLHQPYLSVTSHPYIYITYIYISPRKWN